MKSVGIGAWRPGGKSPVVGWKAVRRAIDNVNEPFALVLSEGQPAVGKGGTYVIAPVADDLSEGELPLLAYVPACEPRRLGDPSFCDDYGLSLPCVGGAMYHGISSEKMVEAMSSEGMLAFFGTGGLSLERIEQAIDRIQEAVGDGPYGFNLLHSPNEPAHEAATVDLYLKKGVKIISAAAYIELSLPLVKFRLHGIHRNDRGDVVTPNRIIAKVSRVEVASRFFSPPPEKFIRRLLDEGEITSQQAEMAGMIPMAEDLTAEADSGGHTDNRPFITMLPAIMALRDKLREKYNYSRKLRVGAGGGLSTPMALAAAFSMGAAYIVGGSVNQSCVESGTSDTVRDMLSQAGQGDVTMAPAADMFEMGVKVQVLKRGTMFPMRAARLYELYKTCQGLDAIPAKERSSLEKTVFRDSLDNVWQRTAEYFSRRDPTQLQRARNDARHKMALVFRWYLGSASNWATSGDAGRRIDYQVQCGPSMGAFNEWVKGSFLESPRERRVALVALNLMHGAAVQTRLRSLGSQGVGLPKEFSRIVPMRLPEVKERLDLNTVRLSS